MSATTAEPPAAFRAGPGAVALLAGTAALYFLGAAIGLRLTAGTGYVSALWPPNAVLLAVLLRSPRRWWPALFAVSFVANAAALMTVTGSGPGSALALALPLLVEVPVALAFSARDSGAPPVLSSLGRALRFAAGGCGLATCLGALVGASLVHRLHGGDFGSTFVTWWASNAAGLLILTPVLLAPVASARLGASGRRKLEAAVLLAVLATCACLLFGLASLALLPLTFLLLPGMLWAALRFGVFGCAVAGMVVAAIAVGATLNGHGPFALSPGLTPQARVLLLQLFLAATIVLPLLIAVAQAERDHVRAELERQRIELLEAEKMVALGTMVSIVAHEVANPNQFLLLNVPVLKAAWQDALPALDARFAVDPELRLANLPYEEARREIGTLIGELQLGAERIRDLVADLRLSTREERSAKLERLDLNQVAGAAAQLLADPIHRATRRFELLREAELPEVMGNFRRLEQVVINLLLNAAQALTSPEQAIRLRTHFDPRMRQVELTVDDEGRGIAAEDLGQIFAPFFTTRAAEGGSGLGLAVADRIAREHGGQLQLASEPGRGTRATLRLPALDERLTGDLTELLERP